MSWTGDPLKDFDRYDAQQQAALDKLPKCAYCGHPIQDDYFYLINDEAVCPECLDNNHRKWTEDYVE